MRYEYTKLRSDLLKKLKDKMIEVDTFLRDDDEENKPNNSLKRDAVKHRRAP